MSRSKQPITIYSILALVLIVVGGGGVLLYSFIALDNWMASGEKFKVGVNGQIEFAEPGEEVVFYESPKVLPGDPYMITLLMSDPNGDRVVSERYPFDDAEDYAPRTILARTNVLGRPLWKVNIPTAGTYTFRVDNNHEDQDPDLDRIVFGKNPQSFKAMQGRTTMLKLGLLGLVGIGAVGLYIMHGITLRKEKLRSNQQQHRFAGTGFPLEQMD